MEKFCDSLLEIIHRDPGNRGKCDVVIYLGIKHLISEETNKDLLISCQQLVKASSVAIITGFFCHGKACETDGPLGAMVMAKSLLHLGKKVCLVTDANNKPIVEKSLEFMKFSVPLYFFETQLDDMLLAEKIIFEQNLDHVISIERIGPAIDNHYYSMMGRDLTQFVGKTDQFFNLAKEKGINTTAIGDGGNELGMGKVYDEIVKYIKFGDKIACHPAADNIIIAGVSNWGGLAIASVLYKLSNEQDYFKFIFEPQEELGLLKFIVEAGSIDGTNGIQECSVDGFKYQDLHEGILLEFISIVKNNM